MQKRTLRQLLCSALQPVGQTMYVWGGGWNEEDNGAGLEAVSLGVSPRWAEFAERQFSDYDWTKTKYQVHDGLDCSGFVGWVLYNTFACENGGAGYVLPSSQMAQAFSASGWGMFTPADKVTCRCPGDILSTKGHVYISLGQCIDGSQLLVHASPPGVQLSGTVSPGGSEDSEAIWLAKDFMRRCHIDWYARFPENARPLSYLKEYDRMSWDLSGCGVLRDPDGLACMCASQVLRVLCSRNM